MDLLRRIANRLRRRKPHLYCVEAHPTPKDWQGWGATATTSVRHWWAVQADGTFVSICGLRGTGVIVCMDRQLCNECLQTQVEVAKQN